jgi:hypothetical protein
MKAKDRLQKEEKVNSIYDIKCNNCPYHYVGETSKQLKSRLHEHELCVKRNDHLSLVAQHSKENNHTFNFNEAKVIGQGRNKTSRLLKEAWFSDEFSINRHINLPPAYQALRHRIELQSNHKNTTATTVFENPNNFQFYTSNAEIGFNSDNFPSTAQILNNVVDRNVATTSYAQNTMTADMRSKFMHDADNGVNMTALDSVTADCAQSNTKPGAEQSTSEPKHRMVTRSQRNRCGYG